MPQNARKTKPFVDHVMGFTIADGKIWIRCFQISETAVSKGDAAKENGVEDSAAKSKTSKSLATPRLVWWKLVHASSLRLSSFWRSFGGPVIYENKEFVSPNQIRSDLRLGKAGKYNRRSEQGLESRNKKGELGLRTGVGVKEVDELDEQVLFA